MTYDGLDFFAGPGGWDEGGTHVGLTTLGVEVDADACATAVAAGHPRLQKDVYDLTPDDVEDWTGKVFLASPPCVAFSKLNKGHSRRHVDELCDAVRSQDWDFGEDDLAPVVRLPLVMGPWVEKYQPRYVAFEQVPSVRPVWDAYAEVLLRLGYADVWTGILDAADYGAPQHRKRAVLMAVTDGRVQAPEPTHGPKGSRPYVTVGEALGWTSETVRDPERLNDQSGTPVDLDWPFKRPALTIAGRNLLNHPGANANRFNGATKSRNDGFWLTEEEMAILQGFPRDYPTQGTRSSRQKQIGNAVPVQLAAAVLRALVARRRTVVRR